MSFPALLDACTLYGAALSDLLLRLADAGAFRPLWSTEILHEVERNVQRNRPDSPDIRRRLETMREYFPDAAVSGYDAIVPRLTCDPKDRHVLAAAVRGGAAVLVTFNVKDFPPESVEPFDIEVVHPDEFLLDQLDLYPGVVISAVRRLIKIYRNPPVDLDGFVQLMIKAGVPAFAAELPRYFD